MLNEIFDNLNFIKKVIYYNQSYETIELDEFLLYLNSDNNNNLYKNNEIFNFIKNIYYPIDEQLDKQLSPIKKLVNKIFVK